MTATAQAVDASFYDEEYYTTGTKSHYAPYGPGAWADWLTDMVVEHVPSIGSVLDVGCAFGFVVERLWHRKGIPAWGFDVSQFAIEERGFFGRTWVGDCTDPTSWRSVDLALCTEVAEHLTPDQGRALLVNGLQFSNRMLLLIAVDLGDHDDTVDMDGSHINIVPISWWEATAREVGWIVNDASRFNDDWRSSQMSWAGRWVWLTKEA